MAKNKRSRYDDDAVEEKLADGVESVKADQITNGVEHTTAPSDTAADINTRLSNLGVDETLSIRHPVTVNDTAIQIPSDRNVIVDAVLSRPDDADANNISVIENADKTNGDSNITVIFRGGYVDGNFDGQTHDTFGNAIEFKRVDGLGVHRPKVINQNDWSSRIDTCTDVFVTDFNTDAAQNSTNGDGLHFVDTDDVIGIGVGGESEDDLLAITADDKDVSGYNLLGVEGSSTNANVLRLNKAAADLGDGNERRLSDISVNIVAEEPHVTGVVYQGDVDTYFENCSVEATVTAAGEEGVRMNGNHIDPDYEFKVKDSGRRTDAQNVNADGVESIEGGSISITSRNPSQARDAIVFGLVERTLLDINSVRDAADNAGDSHVEIQEGAGVDMRVNITGGGTRGVQLGTGSSGVVDSTIKGTAENVGTAVIEVPGGGSDNNKIKIHGDESEINRTVNGTTTTVNGVGTETANAEGPQNDWPEGTTVDFTDSGDGSGNGLYKLINGVWVEI